MKLREFIESIKHNLNSVYDAREVQAITRAICEDVLNYTPVDIELRQESELPDFVSTRLSNIIERLQQHEPLQYVLGHTQFHGHRFKVTTDTLIPRPETEQLVDLIIDENKKSSDLHVLDIGTGCGCIAIALARALKFPQIDAIDVSDKALAVARENASALKTQVRFILADILSPQPTASYNIIVSNPPYVCENERATMDRNVLDYEPATALFVPDEDPLLYYRAIVSYSTLSLEPRGHIYLEINHRFSAEIKQLLENEQFNDIRIVDDSYGKPRFAIAQR